MSWTVAHLPIMVEPLRVGKNSLQCKNCGLACITSLASSKKIVHWHNFQVTPRQTSAWFDDKQLNNALVSKTST